MLGDPLRFRQILLNLLGNALKFTETGTVSLHLALVDSGLKMSVHDTGIGMDSEALSRLFTPFSQAEASTSRRFGGSGLGLAISKQLVDSMHGQITVDSTVGKGATFHVSLPLVSVAAPIQVPVEKKALVQLGLNVLLAEDVETNRLVAGAMLQKLGCTVTFALNGLEAVAKAAGHDLILMDCQMPDMDGLEATRRLRAAGCTIPIVALTANASEEDRAACMDAGMNAFLTKPIERARLSEALTPYAK